MKEGWEVEKLEKCLEKVTYTNKIHRKDFKEQGDYPVVSQEKDLINGYWNNETDLFKVEKPIVVFGDHTQVKKYIDFDFVLGADYSTPHLSDHRISFLSLVRFHCKPLSVPGTGSVKADL